MFWDCVKIKILKTKQAITLRSLSKDTCLKFGIDKSVMTIFKRGNFQANPVLEFRQIGGVETYKYVALEERESIHYNGKRGPQDTRLYKESYGSSNRAPNQNWVSTTGQSAAIIIPASVERINKAKIGGGSGLQQLVVSVASVCLCLKLPPTLDKHRER